MAQAARVFHIASGDEVIAVRADELPDAPSEILDVLKAVHAPLSQWLEFASEYWRQRRYTQFEAVHTAITQGALRAGSVRGGGGRRGEDGGGGGDHGFITHGRAPSAVRRQRVAVTASLCLLLARRRHRYHRVRDWAGSIR
jgi:hypothetical protein